jgi:hypothetical protein
LNLILPGGRGAASVGPNHALLTASGGATDLQPAHVHVPPGSYTANLASITKTGTEGARRGASIHVGRLGGTAMSSLETGLFKLTVFDASGRAVGLPAVVLSLDASDTEARALWADAIAQTSSWSSASQSTIDVALVQVLFALNERR